MTGEVTQREHTSTHHTVSLRIGSDSADLKRELKLTWEIAPARPTAPSPQPLAPSRRCATRREPVPTRTCGSGKVELEVTATENGQNGALLTPKLIFFYFCTQLEKASSKIKGNEWEADVDWQVEASGASTRCRLRNLSEGIRGAVGEGKASEAASAHFPSPQLPAVPCAPPDSLSLPPTPSLSLHPLFASGTLRTESRTRTDQEKSRNSGSSLWRKAGLGTRRSSRNPLPLA